MSKVAQTGAAKRARPASPVLPEVNFSDYGNVRCLHLGTEWVQGSMLIDQPYDIELEYVQRMMAWLLFNDPAKWPRSMSCNWGWGPPR
jgi:spermidine synthase